MYVRNFVDNIVSSEENNTENAEPAEATEDTATEEETKQVDTEEVVNEDTKKRGYQARINQLTAKHKSEIEALRQELEAIKQSAQKQDVDTKQEQEDEPEIETVGDILSLIDKKFGSIGDIIERAVEEKLSKTSQKYLEEEQKTKESKMLYELEDSIKSEYANLFEDDIFIGSDEIKGKIARAVGTFQKDPDTWYSFVKNNGFKQMVRFLNNEPDIDKKKQDIDRLKSKADMSIVANSKANSKEVEYTKAKSVKDFISNLTKKG